MTSPDSHHDDTQAAQQRDQDDALLADLTAPPELEQARESYLYWVRRQAALPIHKRAERKEAEQLAARWKARLAEAERERYGPGLLERLLSVLGMHRPPNLPNPRRIARGLTLAALIVTLTLVALIVAIVVFWPELQPIVQTLLGAGGSDG